MKCGIYSFWNALKTYFGIYVNKWLMLSITFVKPQKTLKPSETILLFKPPSQLFFFIFPKFWPGTSTHPPLIALNSYCCYNKAQQTFWLKTTHIYYIVILWVRNLTGSQWAKIKMLTKSHSLLADLQENLFPSLFQLLEATHILWLEASFSVFKVSNIASLTLSFSITTFLSDRNLERFPPFKESCKIDPPG